MLRAIISLNVHHMLRHDRRHAVAVAADATAAVGSFTLHKRVVLVLPRSAEANEAMLRQLHLPECPFRAVGLVLIGKEQLIRRPKLETRVDAELQQRRRDSDLAAGRRAEERTWIRVREQNLAVAASTAVHKIRPGLRWVAHDHHFDPLAVGVRVTEQRQIHRGRTVVEQVEVVQQIERHEEARVVRSQIATANTRSNNKRRRSETGRVAHFLPPARRLLAADLRSSVG